MSDDLPFDQMQQLDAEFRDWRTSQSPQQLREYNRIRAALVKLAKGAGMSKKGAKAWASLRFEELRQAALHR
jgi:hypothetical protein